MSEKSAIEIMNFGKENLTKGIYGVIKDEYAKAMLEKHTTEEDLLKAVRQYELKGFRVLYKG